MSLSQNWNDPSHKPLTYDGKMVSYAQFAEDVTLRRFFGDQSDGFYIDVGAHQPAYDSVTAHFYFSGWSGVNIEPLYELHSRLLEERPRDINLNTALSDRVGKMVLIVNHRAKGLSTVTEEIASQYALKNHPLERREVPSTTLNAIFEEHAFGRVVDFLKIDVEGHEFEVLKDFDFQRWRPQALVIEATNNAPERWEPLVLGAGYLRTGADRANRFFVREEDRARAQLLTPPTPDDESYLRFWPRNPEDVL